MWHYTKLDSSHSHNRPLRASLQFHLVESQRTRQRCLATLKCSPPEPPSVITNGTIRRWVYKTQWEVWRWKSWGYVVFWPDEMEKAWIEMFADDKFRNEIQDRWSRFLGEKQVGEDP